jgi:hypothetical protein
MFGARDVGHTIWVVVTATDAGGSNVASSAQTTVVTASGGGGGDVGGGVSVGFDVATDLATSTPLERHHRRQPVHAPDDCGSGLDTAGQGVSSMNAPQ